MKSLICCIVCAWLCVLTAPGAIGQENALDKQAAQIQEGKTSVPELLATYREIIRQDPQNPLGYMLAAAAYHRDESRTLFEKAVAVAPESLPARVNLARYLLRNEAPGDALVQFKKAMALDPSDVTLRRDAIDAATGSGDIAAAKILAGDDVGLKSEIVLAYLDMDKHQEAKKILSELGLGSDESVSGLEVRGRVNYYTGEREQGIRLLMEAWRKEPSTIRHYRFAYPRRSLVQLLNEARRQLKVDKELEEVLSKGVELFPREYSLYEGLWKAKFAEVKLDYTAERGAVRAQVEDLLRTQPASPDLYKAAALGYKMAELPEEAEKINQRVKVEFPFSMPALWVKRGEITREKDLRKRLAMMEQFNREFLTMTLHKDYFDTLIELKAPNDELLRGAESYVEHGPGAIAIAEVAETFLDRKLFLDRVEQWLGPTIKKNPNTPLDAWRARLLTVYGQLLVLQGKTLAAQKILKPIIELKSQGFSNVDRGKAKFRLAQALEAVGKQSEAMEMYTQAFAESQHYISGAGESAQRLYKRLKRTERGWDDYLGQRDNRYAVIAEFGIERGSKINKPAPDFNMMSLSGQRVSLASLKGKVVIMNFWATWCGPCIKELPQFQAFAAKMKDDPNVTVLAVTTDENRALVAPFIREHKYTFTVLFNEGISTKFGVRGIPATFVLDPQGVIQLRMVGFNNNEPLVPYLEKLVQQFRAKKEVIAN